MYDSSKVGIGVITYNREKQILDVLKSIQYPNDIVDEFVIVNDTPNGYSVDYPSHFKLIQHKENKSVGVSKNDALKHLLKKNCDWIFLLEDDILIQDREVFKKYLDLAIISKVRHLNFAYHGPANMKNGKPNPIFGVEYDDSNKMAINTHCVGAFTLYHKDDLEKVGLIDEFFVNAWEHVEHTYRMIKNKVHPPFWNFADVWESNRFFKEIGTVESTSVIRKDSTHSNNIHLGMVYFNSKHGIGVLSIPETPQNLVYESLEKIQCPIVEVPSKCITVNVIIPVLTTTDDLYQTTLKCLDTLKQSEHQNKIMFIPTIVESNKEYDSNKYPYPCKVIIPEDEFNYNKFCKIGMSRCTTESDWYVFSNNDVLFHPDWFSEILKQSGGDLKDVMSFSPWNPYGGWHDEKIGKTNKKYHIGTRVSYELCGWCIVFKKDILKLVDFDDRVNFYYSDDVYADELKNKNLKHALITNSIVEHLISNTLVTLPLTKRYGYSDGQLKFYREEK